MDDRLRRLRVTTTIVATFIVAAALVVSAFAMVWFVGRSLTQQIRESAEARADEIAARVVAGLPTPLFVDPAEESVQLLAPGEPAHANQIEGDYLTVTRQVKAADGSAAVVLVQRGLDDMQDAQHTVARGLLYGVPVLIILTTVVTWVVVGRALVPVRQAQERVRRFTADAAHELRSPVAAIRQQAEVAVAHPEQIEARELALAVVGESVRLQRIVDDLLLLARLDEGTPGARVEVDLDDLVLEEATRLRAIAAAAIDTQGVGAGRVLGDRSQLERLVRNLCDNAARYARASIALGVVSRDGDVLLTVDDDGPGIPVADRDRAFDRFVRFDEARDRPSGGTGLGLAIVREIARAHGGDAEIGDAPLGGLRASVRLPDAPKDQSAG